ncbi:DUF3093 domain-containing protein, partial [Streptomyces sp. NPDC005180]|uniref:DUF3093 domain-containing protein n=1 Tax=Streptomyces sp. NPDC005180 TaxID=3156868 RepID=UPI0033A3EF82
SATPADSPVAPRYDERLTAPRSWWLITVMVALSGGLVLLPLGPVPMLGGLIAAGALAAAAVSSYGSARIRVVADSLVAGDARIPVSALGEAEVLDAEEARAWRSYKADPRAFMLLRSYVPTETSTSPPATSPAAPQSATPASPRCAISAGT